MKMKMFQITSKREPWYSQKKMAAKKESTGFLSQIYLNFYEVYISAA
jgi:hypothetical protein